MDYCRIPNSYPCRVLVVSLLNIVTLICTDDFTPKPASHLIPLFAQFRIQRFGALLTVDNFGGLIQANQHLVISLKLSCPRKSSYVPVCQLSKGIYLFKQKFHFLIRLLKAIRRITDQDSFKGTGLK